MMPRQQKPPRRHRSPWTPDEDRVLRSFLSVSALCRELGRTRHAIYQRRCFLGITCSNRAVIAELCARYGISVHQIYRIGLDVVLATPEPMRALRFGWKDAQAERSQQE